MNGASSSEGGPTNLMKESKKPKYTKFTQQELPACKPLLTPGWVMATFMVVGIIFIPIGAVTLLASNSVVEVVHRQRLMQLEASQWKRRELPGRVMLLASSELT